MSTIDAVGNIHDTKGQFAGRVRGEADPAVLSAWLDQPTDQLDFADWAVEQVTSDAYLGHLPATAAIDTYGHRLRALIDHLKRNAGDASETRIESTVPLSGTVTPERFIMDMRRHIAVEAETTELNVDDEREAGTTEAWVGTTRHYLADLILRLERVGAGELE